MTRRGVGFLLAALLLVLLGWRAAWPEMTVLGAGALGVVMLCLVLTAGRRSASTISADQPAVRVVRGQPAAVTVYIEVKGSGRGCRLADGAIEAPRLSMRLPRPGADGRISIRIPIDTSARGQHRVGPFSVVHGDPWGIVRRVSGRTEGGVVTVQPRVHLVRRSLTTSLNEGDSEQASRRAGDQQFHALRDYVLGDEPRTVHWRSSARAGKLVVRQSLSSASTGTTIVLDVDSSAYPSSGAFATGWDRVRFEKAVETAASLAAAQRGSTDQVHLITTARGATVTSASSGAVNALLDALSVTQALPPLETAPEELSAVVRRTRAAHVIVITGSPGHRSVQSLQRTAQSSSVIVVFVGSGGFVTVAGAKSLHVNGPEDLVSA
jgi:uncharacterized protein (DUF58 family)